MLQVLWELYTRKLPQREMDAIAKGITPPIPDDCPEEYAFIMKRCWARNPNDRPTFKVCGSLPFVLFFAHVCTGNVGNA
jgi:hypothetical protein